jgi:hypothetical protein
MGLRSPRHGDEGEYDATGTGNVLLGVRRIDRDEHRPLQSHRPHMFAFPDHCINRPLHGKVCIIFGRIGSAPISLAVIGFQHRRILK